MCNVCVCVCVRNHDRLRARRLCEVEQVVEETLSWVGRKEVKLVKDEEDRLCKFAALFHL
jgi:hypothetical protein